MYVCICVCMYICMYVFMYVSFIYMVYCLSHYSGNTASFKIILVYIYSYLIILHLICQIVFR